MVSFLVWTVTEASVHMYIITEQHNYISYEIHYWTWRPLWGKGHEGQNSTIKTEDKWEKVSLWFKSIKYLPVQLEGSA